MAITMAMCVIVRVEHTSVRHEATPGTSISVSSQDTAPKMCAGNREICAHIHREPGTVHREPLIILQQKYLNREKET